jgi:hypothetical protein
MKTLSIILQVCGVLWLSAGWAAAGIIINPYAFGTAEPSWVIRQGFEGTGYDNAETWTQSGSGTIDPDYTGLVLAGSQSLRLVTSGTAALTYRQITGQSTLYCRWRMRIVSIDSSAQTLMTIRAGTTLHASLVKDATGKLRVTAGGGTLNTSTDNIPVGTDLWMWAEYEQGTGSNSIARGGWSTTDTKPTLTASGATSAVSSNGTRTTPADRFYLGHNTNTTWEIVWDEIRALGTPF